VPACLDSLLIGLYVLADEFFTDRRGPGRPRKITDAELVCLAVAQVLLDCRLLNLLIFESTSIHDELWLIDGTPIACGQSRQTSRRSELAGYAAYGYCKSQHRHYWASNSCWSAPRTGCRSALNWSPLTSTSANPPPRSSNGSLPPATSSSPTRQAFEQLVAGQRPVDPSRSPRRARPARLAGLGGQWIESVFDTLKGPALPRTPRRAHDARPARSSRHPSTRAGRRYTPQPTRRHLGPQPHRL
jgi:hypothetical protein